MSTDSGHLLGKAVRRLYAAGQTDYMLEPLILIDRQGRAVGRIEDGDSVIFCCRRGEREIQLTEAFVDKDFQAFSRPDFHELTFVILTLYHEKFKDIPVAFAPSSIQNTLGQVVSQAGLRQFRTAESEKFAHITFFFNGGNNVRFAGEDDLRIPSRKDIPPDQSPELRLPEVTQAVLQGIGKRYDLIVTNFANGDVIGHTSNNIAKIKCAEAVDHALGLILQKASQDGYITIVTADHGNLEQLYQPDGSPHVAHTSNPVPFIVIDPQDPKSITLRTGGSLRDIAPTLLGLMGLDQPKEMDSSSLVSTARQCNAPVLLIILDGWGIGETGDANPISTARTPVWDQLLLDYPSSQLSASGESVGLQPGKPGNSEAGHMNIGAGRIVAQDDVRLDRSMKDGSFFSNDILCKAIVTARQKGKALHLLALLTEKSSHGSIDYPLALVQMAKSAGLKRVFLHTIFDGRSTKPGSAPDLLEKLEQRLNEIGLGEIVTGVGRGFALDRDGNYARTQKAFDALVSGAGTPYSSDDED